MEIVASGSSAPGSLHLDDVARLRKAFWESGRIDSQALPEAIGRSWQRSRSYGIEPDLRPTGETLTRAALTELRERNEMLLRVASPILDSLRKETDGTFTGLLLSDANGVLISVTGDTEFLDITAPLGARVGVCWSEAERGTNAMGTALAEAAPVVVHGAQHYMEMHSIVSCVAAPICDPRGGLLGALDLSTHQCFLHPHSLALVRFAVAAIERQLFPRLTRGRACIRFHPRGDSLGTWGEGMISVDANGFIDGANDAAGRLLGLPAATVRGRRFEELFDMGFERYIEAALAGNGLAALATCRGLVMNAVLERGGEGVAARRSTVVTPGVAAQAKRPLDELDTGDAELRATIERVRRVNGRGINLLILGETGTGKEMLARRCHEEDARHSGTFVALNCAAIPESLIESELFGYSEGAFTGARRKGYSGKVVEAHGGTLFLDEIGDMPLHLQARLLRVIQERTVTPLGGGRPVEVDFALICATHQNLEDLVVQGRFREDLYYRIKGLVLKLPPLRARSDLAALAVRLLCVERNRPSSLADEVLTLFRGYRWPGNVRQLHSVLRTAALFMDEHDSVLRWEHLPEDFLDMTRAPIAAHEPAPPFADAMALPNADLDTVSRLAVQRVVDACKGNISAAARQLKVSRNTIYRKLGGGAS